MKKQMNFLKITLCCIVASFFQVLTAQDGSLDESFGNGGYSVFMLNEEETFDYIRDYDVNINGTSLITGSSDDSDYQYLYDYMVRLLENGEIDTDFANDGILYDFDNELTKVATLSTGKIVVAKYNSITETVSLNSLFAGGTLDVTFGDNGEIFPLMPSETLIDLIIDNEDKILVVGLTLVNTIQTLFVKKYMGNGVPDTSYGNNGVVYFNLVSENTQYPEINDIKISENDNILITYKVITEGSMTVPHYIANFNLDGSYDADFGVEGIVIHPLEVDNSSEESTKCKSNYFEDGSVLSGCVEWGINGGPFRETYKFTSNGTLDTSFGTNGVLENAYGVLVQTDQKFLSDESFYTFEGIISPWVKRYDINGIVDTSFQYVNNAELFEFELVLLQDGKIMSFGSTTWYNGPINHSITRHNNSPLGVEENIITNVSIFPNPSSGLYTVQFASLANNLSYQVTDVVGNTIKTGVFRELENRIDLSSLASGMYFLKVDTVSYKLLKD